MLRDALISIQLPPSFRRFWQHFRIVEAYNVVPPSCSLPFCQSPKEQTHRNKITSDNSHHELRPGGLEGEQFLSKVNLPTSPPVSLLRLQTLQALSVNFANRFLRLGFQNNASLLLPKRPISTGRTDGCQSLRMAFHHRQPRPLDPAQTPGRGPKFNEPSTSLDSSHGARAYLRLPVYIYVHRPASHSTIQTQVTAPPSMTEALYYLHYEPTIASNNRKPSRLSIIGYGVAVTSVTLNLSNSPARGSTPRIRVSFAALPLFLF